MRVSLPHSPEAKAQIAQLHERDGYVSDISLALRYRPELFGMPFSASALRFRSKNPIGQEATASERPRGEWWKLAAPGPHPHRARQAPQPPAQLGGPEGRSLAGHERGSQLIVAASPCRDIRASMASSAPPGGADDQASDG